MKYLGSLVVLACCIALTVGFTTSGNKILDSNGDSYLIRGIARPSLEWNSAGQYLSLSDYQLMKGWGANTIRVSLNQCFYTSGCVGYNSSYAATIAQQVTWITGLGMNVILDLHWSNQGNTANGCGQQSMPDSISTQFWQSIASTAAYKNNAQVIFEIYNEPFGVAWNIWKNGGSTGSFTTPGFQAIYNAIRAEGANNLVIIGGLNYAYDLSGVSQWYINGTNIAYNTHPYNSTGKDPSTFYANFGYLTTTFPVIATEFGTFDCSSAYCTDFMSYANQKGVHWCAWGWFVSGCGFPSLITDWNGTPLASCGTAVKAALSATTTSTTAASATTTHATSTTTHAASTSTSTTTHGTSTSTTTHSATTSTTTHSTTGSTTGSAYTYQVYVDSVVSPFQDYSWDATRTAQSTAHVYSGSYAYGFAPAGYGGIYFYYASSINPTYQSSIVCYIYVTDTATPNVNFALVSGGNIAGADEPVTTYTTTTLAVNTWTKVQATLSNWATQNYDGFWFQDKSGGSSTTETFWIDACVVNGK